MTTETFEFDPVGQTYRATVPGYYWVAGQVRQLRADEGVPIPMIHTIDVMVHAENPEDAWNKALSIKPLRHVVTAADLWWKEERRVLMEMLNGS